MRLETIYARRAFVVSWAVLVGQFLSLSGLLLANDHAGALEHVEAIGPAPVSGDVV